MTDDPKSTWYGPPAGSAAFVEAVNDGGGGGGVDATAMHYTGVFDGTGPWKAGDVQSASGQFILFVTDVASGGDINIGTNVLYLSVDLTTVSEAIVNGVANYPAQSVHLTAPDSTVHALQVANDGTLSTTPA